MYDDTSLFDGSDKCENGEQGLDGVAVTSIVSVSDSADMGGENVTITFSGIRVSSVRHTPLEFSKLTLILPRLVLVIVCSV